MGPMLRAATTFLDVSCSAVIPIMAEILCIFANVRS